MSRIKPLVLHFESISKLNAAQAEYEYIGRETDADFAKLTLTVRVYPRWSKKRAKQNSRLQSLRKAKNSYEYATDDEPNYEDRYADER